MSNKQQSAVKWFNEQLKWIQYTAVSNIGIKNPQNLKLFTTKHLTNNKSKQ